MCLEVREVNENTQNDIFCYKDVIEYSNYWESFHMNYKYYKRDIDKVIINNFTFDINCKILTKGVFYAYSIENFHIPVFSRGLTPILCKFPKSSTVFYGIDDLEIASNKIIVLGNLDPAKLCTLILPENSSNNKGILGVRKILSRKIKVYANLKNIKTPFINAPVTHLDYNTFLGGFPVSFSKSEEFPDEVIVPMGHEIWSDAISITFVNYLFIPKLYNKMFYEEVNLPICKD